MHQFIESLLPIETPAQQWLYNLVQDPLSNVPFHANTAAVTRYIAREFPFHFAVHEVSVTGGTPKAYTEHAHDDCDEINLICSPGKLVYKIVMGARELIVKNNKAIWIPAGMLHSANVLEGQGYYIAMRLPRTGNKAMGISPAPSTPIKSIKN